MRITEPYTIFLRTLPSGKQIYYYQYRDENGRRSAQYSTGTDKLSQARRFCNKLYNEGKFSKNSGLLFKSFASGFFDEGSPYRKWKKTSGEDLAPSTLQSYIKLLNNQLIPYFGDVPINKINTDSVKQWIVWMNENWSAKTSNNAQSVLNIILKSAKEKRLIKEVPSADLSFRKVRKKERQLLTVKELSKIYSSGLWKWECARTAFLVCAITGMRIGEVVGLQSFEVAPDRLNVEHSLHPKFGLGPTKTRVCRYVPIPPCLNLKQRCGSKWAFQKPDSEEPVSAHYIYMHLMTICESLGIDHKERGITVHSLRNMFISYMRGSSFGETIDLKIKAVVGHADSTQTDWYTYWTPEMFPEIYEVQEKLYREITNGKN